MTSISNFGLHQGILPDVHHADSAPRGGTKRPSPTLSERAEMVHKQINQGLEHLSGQSLAPEDFKPISELSELLNQVPTRTDLNNKAAFLDFHSNLKKKLFRPRGRQHPLATREEEKQWCSLYIAACFISVFDFLIRGKTYEKNLTNESRLVILVNYIVEFCLHRRGIASIRIYAALSAVPTILARPIESWRQKLQIAEIVEGNIAWERIEFDNSWTFFPFPLIVRTLCSSTIEITVEEIYRAMGFGNGNVLNVFGLQNQLLEDNGGTAVQMKSPTSQADHFRADSSFPRNDLLMGQQSSSNISPVSSTVPAVEGYNQPSGAPCAQEVHTHAIGIYTNSRYVEAYNYCPIPQRTIWLHQPDYSYPCNSQSFVPHTSNVVSATEVMNTQVGNTAAAVGTCIGPGNPIGYHENPRIDVPENGRYFETLNKPLLPPQRHLLQTVGNVEQQESFFGNIPQRLESIATLQEGHTSFIPEKVRESRLLMSQPLPCEDHNFTLGNTMPRPQDGSSFLCGGRSMNSSDEDENMHGEQFSKIGKYVSVSLDRQRQHQW